MHDGDIDYSRYTVRELEEANSAIRPEQYPRNYAAMRAAYIRLTGHAPPAPGTNVRDHIEHDPDADPDELPPVAQYDATGTYVPNHVPEGERCAYLIMSVLLLAYAGYGVWVDDLYVPGKRGGLHLHGYAAWALLGAVICLCLAWGVTVVDHYDRRDNEIHYWTARRTLKGLGWVGLLASFFLSVYSQHG